MKQLVLILCLLVALPFAGCHHGKNTANILAEAEALVYEYPDSALQLMESISLPEQLTGKEQADYALLLTQTRSRCRITATSDSLIQIAVHYYQQSHDNSRKAQSYLYLADVYMDMQKYTEAIAPLKQAEEVIEDAPPYIQSLIYGNLIFLNRHSGNHQLAFKYYQKAQSINLTHNYQEWYISNLVNIINLPLQEVQDSISTYIENLEKVLLSTRPEQQAKAYNNIGIYYQREKQWILAEQYYQKAIRTSPFVPYRSYLNLARIYDGLGYSERADSLYQEALHSPVWATRAVIYKDLYNRYLTADRHQEAVRYINLYQAAADSFYTQQKSKEIMEMQLKYEHEVMERQKAETNAHLYLIIILSIGILLTFSIVVYLYYTYTQKKQEEYLDQIQEQICKIQTLKNQTDNLEKEKNNIQEEAKEMVIRATDTERNKTLQEKNEKEKKIKEIEHLNHLLKESRILNEEFLQSKGGWASMDDVRALGLYIRLQQDPILFNPDTDLLILEHWLNIAANGFIQTLTTKYPNLNPSERCLCYLKKAGFSYHQIASILHVKPESINRYIYRTCENLGIAKSKTVFEEHIKSL